VAGLRTSATGIGLPCLLEYPTEKDRQLAKPNYDFAKRQRELAKKQKKEEKLKRKQQGDEGATAEPAPAAPDSNSEVVQVEGAGDKPA
jgi:hypothetical protein